MDKEEFERDFDEFKIYMQLRNFEEAAKIMGDYIIICSTNPPKTAQLPVYNNVKILLEMAPPELHHSFIFFCLAISKLTKAADEGRLSDFRWRLN